MLLAPWLKAVSSLNPASTSPRTRGTSTTTSVYWPCPGSEQAPKKVLRVTPVCPVTTPLRQRSILAALWSLLWEPFVRGVVCLLCVYLNVQYLFCNNWWWWTELRGFPTEIWLNYLEYIWKTKLLFGFSHHLHSPSVGSNYKITLYLNRLPHFAKANWLTASCRFVKMKNKCIII